MPLTDSPTLALTKQLISCASVTPDDRGCQTILLHRLKQLGFTVEHLPFGEVNNFWARRGTQGPVLAFAGHTDVVPPGNLDVWDTPPFEPTVKDGYLYGRGAADMKGSIAAWMVALEQFIAAHPNHQGSLALLITSDEEGPAINGTVKVIETLQARQEHIDWCLVGEPSSTDKVGDVIKNGRRGSLTANITIQGIQGHVAYPHLACNPIHEATPALAELVSIQWDNGNEGFPPTSFQIVNIHSDANASNIIPAQITLQGNFRYSTEVTAEVLKTRVEACLDAHKLNYTIAWTHSGLPFLTPAGSLVNACRQAIKNNTGLDTTLSTSGGTSDGRFIAPTGAQVVELGPCNATIHQINENVNVADLDTLTQIYYGVMAQLLS